MTPLIQHLLMMLNVCLCLNTASRSCSPLCSFAGPMLCLGRAGIGHLGGTKIFVLSTFYYFWKCRARNYGTISQEICIQLFASCVSKFLHLIFETTSSPRTQFDVCLAGRWDVAIDDMVEGANPLKSMAVNPPRVVGRSNGWKVTNTTFGLRKLH